MFAVDTDPIHHHFSTIHCFQQRSTNSSMRLGYVGLKLNLSGWWWWLLSVRVMHSTIARSLCIFCHQLLKIGPILAKFRDLSAH